MPGRDARLGYLAANIRRLREAKGLTQEQLAELAGIAVRYLQTLECARGNPTVTIVLVIADALDTDMGNLFRVAKLRRTRPGRPSKRTS